MRHRGGPDHDDVPSSWLRGARRGDGRGSSWAFLAGRTGDGERGLLADIAFQAEHGLPGAPEQGIAGGEAGRDLAVVPSRLMYTSRKAARCAGSVYRATSAP
jgi:hypothetical protein